MKKLIKSKQKNYNWSTIKKDCEVSCITCKQIFYLKKGDRTRSYCSRKCYRALYYEENRDYFLAHSKKCYPINRLNKYNLSEEHYQNLLETQNYKCAICLRNITIHDPIDHNHNTNKVRGILCHSCNLGLGKFLDSVDLLQAAIEYLKLKDHEEVDNGKKVDLQSRSAQQQ